MKTDTKKSPGIPVSGAGKVCPIVAIGASAGGLDAIKQLLQYLDPGMGMIFFYVQHLSPNYPSSLATILAQDAKIKVHEAENMMTVHPGNLYVCTPNKEMRVANGVIKLNPRNDNHLPYLPIDDFFCSLAETYKENVIGIVLSGNATDGTIGLKAIRDAGGITFAQDNSAKYSSMPQSAISADVVDFVLSPQKIALELIAIGKVGYVRPASAPGNQKALPGSHKDVHAVLDILHKNTGVDFTHYKMATIGRRLQHRMQQQKIKTVREYLKLLPAHSDEIELLYQDMLINVTNFFRDKEAYMCLKKTYLPQLLKNKKPGEALRVWVPACSSGEEAYSIAILLCELQNSGTVPTPVQIFATDLSEKMIGIARIGVYTEGELKGITPSRIKKFFTKEGTNYRVSKGLRDMCVFSVHNILSDPPFSRMDLISCRNLLIYFEAAAQKRVMLSAHFALNDGGLLMLGKAETTGASTLFSVASPKYKIFTRKKNNGIRKIPDLVPRFLGKVANVKKTYIQPAYKEKSKATDYTYLNNAIDAILLSGYMPACAVINKELEILQFRGTTSLYLQHQPGKASLNILKMIKPEFALELRGAINKAIQEKKQVSRHGIDLQVNAVLKSVALHIFPLDIDWDEPLLLVVFTLEEQFSRLPDHTGEVKVSAASGAKIKKLSEELTALRGEIHTIIESQEIAYEELQAANEEIISSNEEFQTLNEELETTKEEIEASNEELTTTNQELRIRNEMLVESNNFSDAIINTMHEPLLILNHELNVKSANRSFYKIFNANKEATEGVSIFELGNKQWNIPELHHLLEKMLFKNDSFTNFKVTHIFPQIGEKVMLLNASKIDQKSHGEQLILLAIDDITELARTQEIEKQTLHKHINETKVQNEMLEKAVKRRTKQIEQAQKILEEKNTELELANKELTTFTYISSHDLQEPLRKLQIFSTLIQKNESQNLSDSGKGLFDKLQYTAKRMQMLLEDLLVYSHTKNVAREFVTSSLNVVLDKIKIDFEDIIEEKKATIEYGKLHEANIIPFQFSILMSNLISNSLKFSDPQKPLHITIKTRLTDNSRIKSDKLQKDKKYCHISIQDNGIGFDNQYKDRIFEVFQRLHTRDVYEGIGIGLAICKRIVDIHYGFITATGKMNGGAKFDIYIPA